MTSFNLQDLEIIISSRAGADAETSYTAQLAKAGINKAAQKLGEEAVETIIAAVAGGKSEVIGEAADVLYHLLVVLHLKDVAIADVLAELQARTTQSGLEEKTSRS